MSVILTEINMPKSCFECKYQQCYFHGKEWTTIDGKKNYKNSVDRTCPLRSIEGLIALLQKEAEKDMSGYHPDLVYGYILGLNKGIEHIKEYCEVEE